MGHNPLPPPSRTHVVRDWAGRTHERDVWIEITQFGDTAPRHLLAVDGREVEIAEAQDLYIHDRIGVDELERRIGNALELVFVCQIDESAGLKDEA